MESHLHIIIIQRLMEREASEAMGEVELVCGWWEIETIYGMAVWNCSTWIVQNNDRLLIVT